jgi:DNA-binding MarR family transcriptional regulator
VRDHQLPTLAADLTLYAARLMRLLRRERRQPVGMRVLSILDESGALGITQLAAIDQCSQPTMSGTVNGLVERGWVTKAPDAEDARSSRVALTAAGRRTLARAREENGAVIADRLRAAGTNPDDVATAIAVLRSVVASADHRAEHRAGTTRTPSKGTS